MMVLAAALKRIPRVILEPNAYPGLANKAVGPFVQRVFLAFESAARFFDQRKGRVVGTPVRKEFLTQMSSWKRDAARRSSRIGLWRQSSAKALNNAAIEGLPDLLKQRPYMTVTHQTGEADHDRVSQAYRRAGVTATVLLLYDMPAAINAADVVVARAGAMTVAELTTCGKPAILIPLPTAIYDHQMKMPRS